MERVTITMSYIDLLEKTANVLGFDNPVYVVICSPEFRGYVRVSSKTSLLSYVFDEDSLGTFNQSCEHAAKKALLFFVRNKNVCIHDVNFERVARLRKCHQLYALNCFELDSIENGIADARVHVTPVECIRYGDEAFQAWFTIQNLGAAIGTHCVIGDRASSINDVKQVLAQKAISMLVAYCGIIVEDINSCLIPNEEADLKALREMYVARKDSVYGLQEQMSPTPNIIEQDQFTPCGKLFAISTPDGPPLPPKKRKTTTKILVEASVPHSIVVAALDTLAAESHDPSEINVTIAAVEKKKILLEIAPRSELTTSYVLKWIIRKVEDAPTVKAEAEDLEAGYDILEGNEMLKRMSFNQNMQALMLKMRPNVPFNNINTPFYLIYILLFRIYYVC